MRYFPLFADLHDRRVLVVGGGAVAERKVRLLLDAGARVRLVAPEVTAWLGGNPSIEVHREQFDPQHFAGAVLAVAATDERAVNEAVAAQESGIMLQFGLTFAVIAVSAVEVVGAGDAISALFAVRSLDDAAVVRLLWVGADGGFIGDDFGDGG